MSIVRLPIIFLWLCLLLIAEGIFAHPLPGDPEGLEEQLMDCSFDLFRTRRPQGGFYAGQAQRVGRNLLEQHFGLAFERNNPYPPRTDEELISQLAGPIAMFATDVAYGDLFPEALAPLDKLWALAGAINSVENAGALRAVAGTGDQVVVDGTPFPPELIGSIILAAVVLDLQDIIERIPQVAVTRLGAQLGNVDWTLDGVPLSPLAFDALVSEVDNEITNGSREDRIGLAGGPCVHAHPRVLNSLSSAIVFIDQEGGDAQMDDDGGSEIFSEEITVSGEDLPPVTPQRPRGTNIGGGIPGAQGRPGPGPRPRRPINIPPDGFPDEPISNCESLEVSCSQSGNCSSCNACFDCCEEKAGILTSGCEYIIEEAPWYQRLLIRFFGGGEGNCLGMEPRSVRKCKSECAAQFVVENGPCPDAPGFIN